MCSFEIRFPIFRKAFPLYMRYMYEAYKVWVLAQFPETIVTQNAPHWKHISTCCVYIASSPLWFVLPPVASPLGLSSACTIYVLYATLVFSVNLASSRIAISRLWCTLLSSKRYQGSRFVNPKRGWQARYIFIYRYSQLTNIQSLTKWFSSGCEFNAVIKLEILIGLCVCGSIAYNIILLLSTLDHRLKRIWFAFYCILGGEGRLVLWPFMRCSSKVNGKWRCIYEFYMHKMILVSGSNVDSNI